MSRIGKQPIPLPKGVKATFEDGVLTVTGPGGTLQRSIHPRVRLQLSPQEIRIFPCDNSRVSRPFWGLTGSLVANMVTGVSQGFTRKLEIEGKGYKVEVKDNRLVFSLGYSQPVEFPLVAGIKAEVEKGNRITLHGADKETVGQVAANIRRLRPVEPYKGKGIKYAGEILHRKVGKAGR
ncbi:MAG: 50S ribosomal protein L6 [Deltaproteobacteria bacterium]|nr:50S ribosomal protein L6 [Deltaproteobacteria bacterium]MBW1952781.1 50S ribosomal protein L6 [Deltaproteobacteria bacterium]MBW1987100.1 50S ribosomal protein L6 [Deltaproteobacteria bacterium]MBW2135390.1 50S ribosomal protein L6 [Deltaproteobacteria bacterium]